MNIYVGNLSRDVTEDDLRQAFAAFGEVSAARIITDKNSNEPRGFGFVEMSSSANAQAAITGLNGTELKGKTLTVNEAQARSDSRSGGYGNRNSDNRGGYGNRGGRGGRRLDW